MVLKPANKSKGTSSGGGTGANAPQPIGVEKGFVAHQPYDLTGMPPEAAQYLTSDYASIAPRYFAGEEWRPATLPTDQIIDLQMKLQAAGLYTSDFHKGTWDAVDAAAYSRLLGQANAAGVDKDAQLASAIQNPRVDTTPRKPLTVTLTNPDDIRAVVSQVGDSLYGGSLPDSTRESIVAAVQASERQAQEQAYALDPTGGTMTLPAGIGAGGHISADALQNLTARTVRQQHPNEVGGNQFASAFDAIMAEVSSNPSGYQLGSYSGLPR